ncbi:MAG: glycosyltransferase family 2 protein [Oscillospiraceae bacterium]|nr:glycosyltransferase family 2 protein [Oscillospiraceae bacterium]
MITLSIVVPVYNVEKYLRECLDSAIVPGMDGYEIVCVNDGSTDSSPEILEEYRKRYPKLIRVMHTENQGLGAASNNGIAAAKGEYIAFLDSDDYLPPESIREMLAACKYGDDIIFFNFTEVNDKGDIIGINKGCCRDEGVFTLESYPQVLFDRPSRANKLFRRTLFEEHSIHYPSRVWFEDYRTNPKLYPFCHSMRYIDKEWYYYRQQPSSITHGKDPSRNLEILDAADDLLGFYEKEDLFRQYREELEYSVFYNVLLTSTDRVNLIDPKSEVQEKLLDYMNARFPTYEQNRYFRGMSKKYKLLHFLIKNKQYMFLNTVLHANNWIKGK